MADSSIIQLKHILNTFNNIRELKILKLSNNTNAIEKYRQLLTNNSEKYSISKAKIIIKGYAWINLYDAIRNIIAKHLVLNEECSILFKDYLFRI